MPRNPLTAVELESMRGRLCSAAHSLYLAHGLDAVTFRSLAEAVGVSHTLPYRYFDNKEALLASVRVLCFGQFERFVREREATQASALGRVLAVLDAYVDFVLRHPAEYSLIFATAQPPPQRYPELLAARRRLFEHSVGLVRRCVDAGLVTGDARTVTHTVWAALHGLLSLHVANQLVHGCSLEDLVEPTIGRILGLKQQRGADAARRGADTAPKVADAAPKIARAGAGAAVGAQRRAALRIAKIKPARA
jgi:AcrR family transcriptional regulator